MLKYIFSTILVFTFSTVASAQVYLVHGIDGRELGLAQANPVDVSLNGNCVLRGVTFQQISAAIPIAAGRYEAAIRTANGSCTGPLSITGSFDVALNESLSVVAHLNEQGVPTITKFSNDPRTTEGTRARLVFRHTAGGEPVQARIRRLTSSSVRTFGGFLPAISNGEQQALELVSGKYSASIFTIVGFKKRVFGSEVTLLDDKLMAIYVVGSFKGNSVALIVQNLETVK